MGRKSLSEILSLASTKVGPSELAWELFHSFHLEQ